MQFKKAENQIMNFSEELGKEGKLTSTSQSCKLSPLPSNKKLNGCDILDYNLVLSRLYYSFIGQG